MKMTKQTKMLLGVGAVAVAGYFIWKQNQEKQNFLRSRIRGVRPEFNRTGRAAANSLLMQKYAEAYGGELVPRQITAPTVGGPQFKFMPGGCAKADCRTNDGYIYCKGFDETGRQNFSNKMQDASIDVNSIGMCTR